MLIVTGKGREMSPSELSGIYSRLRELEVTVQQQDAEISRLRYEIADLS